MNSLWIVALSVVLADPAPTPVGFRTIRIGTQTFTLPADFDLDLVAGPPLIDRPIHADFDERGRLYVCEASGTNDKVEKQLEDKPHWILRLEDTDGDGRFDRRTKFADKFMFPEGMLWHEGSIYVAAPPSIWKLTDADDDGIAEKREEWYVGKTLTSCANDLHGPYAGPDGWLYWCKGGFGRHTVERPGKEPFVTTGTHIFRSRPDGTGVEPVMFGGMDNPVEVIFTPGGERIFTTTFFQTPAGGQRDGLVHAIYGGVYGKQHAVIDGFPRTGDLMPVLTHMGLAAPSGLARYESKQFGANYEGNLFAALFNMHKITRHVLTPQGATFASRDEDFIVSDTFDFHPTDVLEDADGSLLVIDTGGWYKLCCPSSQLWKPEILGGIYRVRRRDAQKIADPRGLKLDWKGLAPDKVAALLADDRPAVRRRAMLELARQGGRALPATIQAAKQSSAASARCLAVWALSRSDAAEARTAIRAALADSDETVRQAAVHAISVALDREAVPQLIELVSRGTAHNRRAAAEALGRLGHAAAVPALLSVAGEDLDRVLQHSVTYALLEIANPEETRAGLASGNLRTRRAALLALDQMKGGGLDQETVSGLLASPDPTIRETAAWIVGRHADWGPALAPLLEKRLSSGGLDNDDVRVLVPLLTQLASNADVQKMLAARLQAAGARPEEQKLILQVMAAAGGGRGLPAPWVQALCHVLATNEALAAESLAVVRAYSRNNRNPTGASELRTALLALAAKDRLPAGTRLEALAAAPGGLPRIGSADFELVLANLAPSAPVSVRLAATDALANATLDEGQLMRLADVARSAGPLEIERIVLAFGAGSSDAVGRALISALSQCPAIINVRTDALQKVFKNYGPAVQDQTQAVYALQAAGTEKQRNKIEELLPLVSQGDVRRGHLVFNSQKAACSTCHAMGYVGGRIGPDLSKIGSTRTERDLLEAIIFPSASFVRSFEPVTILTKSGKAYSGTVRQDSALEIVLSLNAQETMRVARDDIDEIMPGTVSIMPAGLDQQLSPQELADLITFLKAAR